MITLLYGASGSGKSTLAEEIAVKCPEPRFYIATMMPYGEDSLVKIARHREMRAQKRFETIERYTDIAGLELPEGCTALLECMCNLTANEMFEPCGAHERTSEEIMRGIDALESRCGELIIVTNDVGSGGWGCGELTERYIRTLGELNIMLAARAERFIEMVCGCPQYIKGGAL